MIKSTKALIAIIFIYTFGNSAVINKTEVPIVKIASTTDGDFLITTANIFNSAECTKTYYSQGSGDFIKIPTKSMLSTILTAQTTGKKLSFVILNDAAGVTNIPWVGSTKCELNYIEIK